MIFSANVVCQEQCLQGSVKEVRCRGISDIIFSIIAIVNVLVYFLLMFVNK